MKKFVSILFALMLVFTAAVSNAAGQQNDRCEMYLKINFSPNLMLSTYAVDVYVDNAYQITLPHGTDGDLFLMVTPGVHELKFSKSGDNSVIGTYRITIGTDSQVTCTINAHKTWIKTYDVNVTPYDRTGSTGTASAGGKYRLEYSIEFDKNSYFSRYDVIMEIDGARIATLKHGEGVEGSVELKPGVHHIKFLEASRTTNYKYYCFVLESNGVFSCGIHAYDGNVSLKNMQLKASREPVTETPPPGGGPDDDIEVMVMSAAIKKALLLELDGTAGLLKGLKGRPVAAALVSLLKAANDIEFDSGDEENPDSGETVSGNTGAGGKKEIPDGAYERAARYGALITDGDTRLIYCVLLEKEGYDPAKVYPDNAADSDPESHDVTVAGVEEKVLDAGVKKALVAELDGTAQLLKGYKGRPVAAALVSLQKAANDIEFGDGDGEGESSSDETSSGNARSGSKKEIPDGAYQRATRYGEWITDVDTQLTYCALLKKEGYDLAKVYPDGVEVDIDLRKYQPFTGEDGTGTEGSAASNPGEGNPDLSKVLVFSREDKDVPRMSWMETSDPEQLDNKITQLRNARADVDYEYKIRLRVDLMQDEKLSGKTARKLSECTAYVIVDKGYLCNGRFGYVTTRNDSYAMYYTGFLYYAMEAVTAYQVSDPLTFATWGFYTNAPLAHDNVTTELDNTEHLIFIFTYTDGNGKKCRESFFATQYTLWNIPQYMVGQFKEDWADEFLKADQENGVPLLVLWILH